jgi:hypothetical protein
MFQILYPSGRLYTPTLYLNFLRAMFPFGETFTLQLLFFSATRILLHFCSFKGAQTIINIFLLHYLSSY